MQNTLTDSVKKLYDLKKMDDLKRQGITFKTSKSSYLFDTGTGKVVKLDDKSSVIINALFDDSISKNDYQKIINCESAAYVVEFLEKENLLCNPNVKHFISLEEHAKESNLNCEQLIIELTGKCNLCCKYCIYNESYSGNRDFNTSDIDFKTAQKAIDYVYKHRSPDRLAITFYGGEPLIKFDVMKECIDYCLENLIDCNLSFSFTTNLTLMSTGIAEYLAQVPQLNIVLSLDGPKEIHNRARVYKNNQPTFDDALTGLKNLANAIKKYKNKTTIIINCVLMPPYTEERFNQINDFFESLEFLPPDTKVQATYPSPGTVPESYFKELQRDGIDALEDTCEWMSWAKKKANGKDFLNKRLNIYSTPLESSLARIHNRTLFDKPMDIYSYNGCCLPGQRRLYLCTDGSYKVCERVGNSPIIGHVDYGINEKNIKKYYFTQYANKSIGDCSKCWAIHLCDICYADCYDENGMNIKNKRKLCGEVRDRYKSWLSQYYEILETNPDKIEEISKIEYS